MIQVCATAYLGVCACMHKIMQQVQRSGRLTCPICSGEVTAVVEATDLCRLVEAAIAADPSLEPDDRASQHTRPGIFMHEHSGRHAPWYHVNAYTQQARNFKRVQCSVCKCVCVCQEFLAWRPS